MWDLKELHKAGGTAEKLQSKFEADVKAPKIKEFIDHSSSRIKDSITRCQKEASLFWAIDKAFDVSQRQTTFTLAGSLANKDLATNDDVLAAVKEWNLESMLVDVCDANGQPVTQNGAKVKRLDIAMFTNIFVPLVGSYVKARWAKLFGDRDVSPLYKYSPLTLTAENRARCELITSTIQRQATQLGYREDEKQSILQMLLYGTCINFPMEDWYTEKQKIDGKEQITKEGVRFAIPHPSRMFWDMGSRLSSLNTDTGVQFMGYWDVYKYRDIRHNTAYWNREKITKGDSGSLWRSNVWSIYSQLYPCQSKFPESTAPTEGAGDKDRVARNSYGTSEDDAALFLTPMFQKIVPKDWGLFDYEYPVWIRTIFAGDDTVLHCTPMAYTPGCAYLYDADSNRAFATSLGLEILPWQDLVGNYLTQHLLSVKQNLVKAIFYNTDQLDKSQIDLLKNLGEKLYKAPVWIPASRQELSWQQQTAKQAFETVNFPRADTSEIAGAIDLMIRIMERMLGFSPQEIGATASHEQSATEVHITNQNTTVRLQFTGSFVDAGMNARKRILYDAFMAHGSDEVLADVADLNDIKRTALEGLGFEVEDGEPGHRTGVKGDKKNLRLDGFASETEGQNRISDSKVAATMIQTFQSIFSNPAIIQAIGFEQLINLFNQILTYTGLPKEFRLKLDEELAKKAKAEQEAQQAPQQEQQDAAAQIQAQLAEQMTQIAQAAVQQGQVEMVEVIKEKVVAPLKEGEALIKQAIGTIAQKLAQQTQQDGQQDQAIMELMAMFQAAAAPPPPQPMIPVSPQAYDQLPPGVPPV